MTTLKQHIQIHVIYETNGKNQRRMQQEKLSKKGESRKIKFGDGQKMIEPIKEIKKKLKLIEQEEEEAKGDGQLATHRLQMEQLKVDEKLSMRQQAKKGEWFRKEFRFK